MMQVHSISRFTLVALGITLASAGNSQARQNQNGRQGNPPIPPLNTRVRSVPDTSGVRVTTRSVNGYNPNNEGRRERGNMGTGYTSPIAPFILQGPSGNSIYGWNGFNNEVFSYTSPLSPFAQYRGNPNAGRYRYRNGLWGRGSISFGWGGQIFLGGNAYFPYYYPEQMQGYTCATPYAYLWGVNAPYMLSQYVVQSPPAVVYVPYPVYSDQGNLRGWKREDIDDYYLNRKASDDEASKEENGKDKPESKTKEDSVDTPISKVAQELKTVWKQHNIQNLANIVDKNQRIAVYLRGKYQYSLNPTDYLDMTRDALESTKTISFTLEPAKRKEKGVWLLTGKHVYEDKEGEQRSVFVNYVLEERGEKFVLTQVGVAPQRLDKVSRRDTFYVQEEGDGAASPAPVKPESEN